MSEYMSCCDCVITKAGPGTIAEALICGIPIILNGIIFYQLLVSIITVLQDVYRAKKKVIYLLYLKIKLGPTVTVSYTHLTLPTKA